MKKKKKKRNVASSSRQFHRQEQEAWCRTTTIITGIPNNLKHMLISGPHSALKAHNDFALLTRQSLITMSI